MHDLCQKRRLKIGPKEQVGYICQLLVGRVAKRGTRRYGGEAGLNQIATSIKMLEIAPRESRPKAARRQEVVVIDPSVRPTAGGVIRAERPSLPRLG